MPAGAQLIPSARLLAATLVAVASVLHWGGWLPDRRWLQPMMLALPLLLLAGAAAARSPADAVGRVTRPLEALRVLPAVLVAVTPAGISLLVICSVILWRVHDALESRLAPPLEGRDLVVEGIVDGLPQRLDFGDRVRFSLSNCQLMTPEAQAGTTGASLPDRTNEATHRRGSGACGRLARLQLDWGPVREKDRLSPADAGEEATDEGEAIWPRPGEFWRLNVRLRRPVAAVNPGGFDLELRYLQQGIDAIGRVYSRQRLASPPAGSALQPWAAVQRRFEALRTRLRDSLEAVYAHRVDPAGAGRTARWPVLGVVSGLALGDQAAISASLWGLFSRTGVSHLMAISGMHVTMLALAAAWLVSALLKVITRSRIPVLPRLLGRHSRQRLVLLVAVLAAFGYALLSGWGIPAQRTCWMLTAAALMSLSGRGRGVLDITLLSAAVVILIDPWAVTSAGFWLSFGAVAAIVWCAHGHDTQRALSLSLIGVGSSKVPDVLRDAVTSQWAATIGLAPLVVALFSTLSLVGPLANAIAIPWVSFVITPLAVVAALLAPLAEPLAAFLLQLNLGMIEHLISMLSLLDRLPAASAAIARPGPWTLLAACIGAAVMIAPKGVPLRPAGALCLLPMLFGPPQLPEEDELWITALDIGQGSSVLVEAGGQRLLFDAGSGSGPDRSAVSRFLLPYLRSRGIESIDTLVISHLDIEHAGGAPAVLQALRPARLLTSFDVRLLQADAAALSGLRHLPCTAGRALALGAASLQVLHPALSARERQGARSNHSSCVVRIAAAAGSVMLTGDLPATAEAALLEAGGAKDVRSDVLVVPQQGSRNGAGPLLLAAVKPALAILQVGYRNRHRHPHPTVLERFSTAGVPVLRTDLDGAVQIRLRPHVKPTVLRLRRDAPPYWRIDTAAGAPRVATGAGPEAATATATGTAAGSGNAATATATARSSRRRSPKPRRAPGLLPASTGRRPSRRSAPA